MRQWYVLSQEFNSNRGLENYLSRIGIKFSSSVELDAAPGQLQYRSIASVNTMLLTYTVLISESDLSAILLSVPNVTILRPYKELRYKNLLRKYLYRLLKWA